MRIGLPTIVLMALLCASCGSTSSAPTTTAPATTTHVPVSPPPMAITIFGVEHGRLRAESRRVPSTRAVATATLGALGLAAPVTISGGTARVALDHVTDAQTAEIVFTLTQFPTVRRVDVGGRTGLTRDDVSAYVPPILVELPADDAEVSTTFRVAGTASVFEATLVLELVRSGKVLERHTVTASEGAPGRGTFETTVHATPGPLTVRAFAPSAADGSPQHAVDVEVTVRP